MVIEEVIVEMVEFVVYLEIEVKGYAENLMWGQGMRKRNYG